MINKDTNFVSAVVYIHNDEKKILDFFECLYPTLEQNFKEYEIICVDDDSNDNSINLIRNYINSRNTECTVNLVSLSSFHGVELAMNAGIDISIGDYVFEFDCSNVDYDSDLIMQVYRKEMEGYDITSAAPKFHGRLGSKLFYKLLRLGNKNISNIQTENFRLVSRRAINRVKAMNISVPYRQIAYATSGLKMATIDYVPQHTDYALLQTYRRDLAISSILSFTTICDNIAISFSLLSFLFGMYQLLWSKKDSSSMFLWGGMFLIMAIIIKYLRIINGLIFKKQNYIVSNVEKINNGENTP